EAAHRELRRAVGALVGDADEAEHARRVHDRPGVLAQQDRQERVDAVHDALEVDPPHPVLVLRRPARDRRRQCHAGVVEDHAERRRLPVVDLRAERHLRLAVADVEHFGEDRPGERRGRLLERVRVVVGDRHGRPVPRQPLRHRAADPGSGSGDHRRPSADDRPHALLSTCAMVGTHVYHLRAMTVEHLDVLIVGAGLSGIGAAHHLQRRRPGKTYALLEARGDLGGTWDLFRYPGVRSDSDMHTLGFSFKPWTEAKGTAAWPTIKKYLRETARDYGIDKHIRYQHRVTRAAWDSQTA